MSESLEDQVERLKKRLAAQEQQTEQEKQRADHAEGQIQDTSLPVYLRLCHEHYTKSLIVETDESITTQGDVKNAKEKKRPDKIKPWTGFLATQGQKWESLFSRYPKDIPHAFPSPFSVRDRGKEIADEPMSCEQDLHTSALTTMARPVTQILKHLIDHPKCEGVRATLGLDAPIRFSNHMNSLNDNIGHKGGQKLEEQQLFTPPKRNSPSVASGSARPWPD